MSEDEPDSVADDRARRRAAKLWNERLKAFAALMNGLGIVLFVAFAITLPGGRLQPPSTTSGFLAAMALHVIAQLALTFWRSED